MIDQEAAEDGMHEDILAAVAGRQMFAFYLALAVLGQEAYDEWRAQSYDVPSVADHVELALEEETHGEVAARVGIDYADLARQAERDELTRELTGIADELAAEAQA